MGKRMTPSERELLSLTTLSRLIAAHLRLFQRPMAPHTPLRDALEYVTEEKTLLLAAVAGDNDAIKARRVRNGAADSVGE